MNLLSVEQTRAWDTYTMAANKINSLQLMEQAAAACVEWLQQHFPVGDFYIFCGKGNNGGDGLAIARLLLDQERSVEIFILSESGSDDFNTNLQRLKNMRANITLWSDGMNFPNIPDDAILIDAIFGSGLNRAADGLTKSWINGINSTACSKIAIDIPSGLFADKASTNVPVVRATHTLTFQALKPAFLIAENEAFTGEVHVLQIGLDPKYLAQLQFDKFIIDEAIAGKIFRPRKKFAHKGNFGHALLLAGARGKMGAAVLAAKATVGTGAGLLTSYLPAGGNDIMQIAVPEVMCISDPHQEMLTEVPGELTKYSVVGVGPGIGKDSKTVEMLKKLFDEFSQPMVIDADALNIISENGELLSKVPARSILTPHPKEFERLFGKTEDEFARFQLASSKAAEHGLIIVLKGHHTAVCLPDRKIYFNNNGNSGMAKGGSGDTLTGILTGLLAQKYSPEEAAIFGVYLHGLAGDLAEKKYGTESMKPSDLIACLGQAYNRVKSEK